MSGTGLLVESLKQRRRELVTARSAVRRSLAVLTKKGTPYYREHVALLACYDDAVEVFERHLMIAETERLVPKDPTT